MPTWGKRGRGFRHIGGKWHKKSINQAPTFQSVNWWLPWIPLLQYFFLNIWIAASHFWNQRNPEKILHPREAITFSLEIIMTFPSWLELLHNNNQSKWKHLYNFMTIKITVFLNDNIRLVSHEKQHDLLSMVCTGNLNNETKWPT